MTCSRSCLFAAVLKNGKGRINQPRELSVYVLSLVGDHKACKATRVLALPVLIMASQEMPRGAVHARSYPSKGENSLSLVSLSEY
jgi:hypothetical protein